MKLSEIAALLSGDLVGDPDIDISGVAKIEEAGIGDITFVANPKYAKYLETTKASAVIVSSSQPAQNIPHIKLEDPYFGFLKILEKFAPSSQIEISGIHDTCVIEESAKISDSAGIGAFSYIGKNVRIGENTCIYPGCIILDNVQIGRNCKLHANISVREGCIIGDNVIIHDGTVIGSDGFGFAPVEDGYNKIPQLGIVVIEDDVEIGSNSSLDRATMGETRIGRGSKIDNLVQIAHNVSVGPNTVIASQSGISGSTTIGKNVTIAGQVGIVGHVTIGDKSVLAAKSGISKDVPPGEIWFGYPAQQIMRQKKIEASSRHLPELTKKIHQLEKTVITLQEKLKKLDGGKWQLSNKP